MRKCGEDLSGTHGGWLWGRLVDIRSRRSDSESDRPTVTGTGPHHLLEGGRQTCRDVLARPATLALQVSTSALAWPTVTCDSGKQMTLVPVVPGASVASRWSATRTLHDMLHAALARLVTTHFLTYNYVDTLREPHGLAWKATRRPRSMTTHRHSPLSGGELKARSKSRLPHHCRRCQPCQCTFPL